MTRGEAIKHLEEWKECISSAYRRQVIDMAIEALLKDIERHEAVIRASERNLGIVRCKDCDREYGSPVCPIQSEGWAINQDTFYCAWGERSEP